MSLDKRLMPDGIGFVELINHTGTDLDVVNAARVSFHNESNWETSNSSWEIEKVLSDRDKGLIDYLMRERHGTPFEMGFMAQFKLRMPIFVAREHVRHRIGHSINEESGRYVELRPDFYIPNEIRTQTGKPGHYKYEPINNPDLERDFIDSLEASSKEAYSMYLHFMEQGVAKEQARMFLPLNIYTEMRWTVNARSLMNYLSLRNDESAQAEIREFAEALESIFAWYMPVTYNSFLKNERTAP
jgi:thymidylate synthase (FAD)